MTSWLYCNNLTNLISRENKGNLFVDILYKNNFNSNKYIILVDKWKVITLYDKLW